MKPNGGSCFLNPYPLGSGSEYGIKGPILDSSRKTYGVDSKFPIVEDKNYRVVIDEHCQKPIKLPEPFTITVGYNRIICEDGENVRIRAAGEHLEQMQLSFQLAYRCVDNWNHYLRLVDYQSAESRKVEGITTVDKGNLENQFQRIKDLHFDVLLYLRRASDFLNLYSEIAVITALFGLELS